MTHRITWFLLLVASFATAQDGMPIREGYAGTEWGSSRTAFLQGHEWYRCNGEEPVFCAPSEYRDASGELAPVETASQAPDTYIFSHDKLMGVTERFDSDTYESERKEALQKWGPPSARHTGTVQNRFGAKFQDETLEWTGKRIYIVLKRFDKTLDRSSCSFYVASELRRLMKQWAAEGKKPKREPF